MEVLTEFDRAEAVAAFEDAYVDRARRKLGDAIDRAEAAVLDRRPLASGETALAGWWCRPDANQGLLVLPNPWDDQAAVADHDAYCWSVSKLVLDRLAVGLNEHHGLRHSRAYWDLLLCPWLTYVLTAALDRRLYCQALSQLRGDIPVAAGAQVPRPATMVEAVEVVRTDLGNRALGTRLAAPAGLALAPLEQREPADAGAPTRSAGPSLVGRTAAVVEKAAGQLSPVLARSRSERVVTIAGGLRLSTIDGLRLRRRVPGLVLAPGGRPTAVEQGGGEDAEVRERLGSMTTSDQRAAAVAAAACLLLPRTVVEDYLALVDRSGEAYGPAGPVVAANYGPHDAENEFLARCAEAGEPLAFAQHGGAYLQARLNVQERLERRKGSVFVSWGGTGEGVRPLPSPYLQRLRDRYRGGDRVVIVEWVVPPDAYLLRLMSTPLGNQSYRVNSRLAEFVRSITTVRDHLFLKRFPAFVEGAERDPALAALPCDPPRFRQTAARLMAAARLAVIPYPDTPFIEAMVLGVPTIGLWDPELWLLRDDARAPFDALREAGVLFTDPRAAAAHVDDVYDHTDDWWAGPEIQAARRAFLERFAMAGDWLAEWSAFLREHGDG